MKRLIYIFFLGSITLHGCNDEIELTGVNSYERSEKERLLSDVQWRYVTNGIKFQRFGGDVQPWNMFDEYLEPVGGLAFRNRITKRGVKYDLEMMYQLRWSNRGEYNLGYPESSNWQPKVGTWKLDDTGNILIHNPHMEFEQRYTILELTSNKFVRVHQRFMRTSLNQGSVQFPAGTIVTFIEEFRAIN